MNFFWIALGGALGASLRYALGLVVAFPYGTLSVNILGSFLMGLAYIAFAQTGSLFLMAGVLGGFTTFSSFSLDVLKLIEMGRIAPALGYVVVSVGLSLLAVFLGVILARQFT